MNIEISNDWAIFWVGTIIAAISFILVFAINSLINNLKELKTLVEEQDKKHVSRETFEEFKENANKSLSCLNSIRITQAAHSKQMKMQEQTLQEIKEDIHELKKKVYS